MTSIDEIQDEELRKGVRVALAILSQDRAPSPDEVAAAVDSASLVCSGAPKSILLRHIESMISVHQDASTGLDDPRGHVEWLHDARANRTWNFWSRYRRYLEDVKLLPPKVVSRLDASTDRILGYLEDPTRTGEWRRTGLVVGQVQSGKTGNYIALACKAADAGYPLVVVLAGSLNNLRSQTQLRVDEGLLGFDTQHQHRSLEDPTASRAIGVGALPGGSRLDIASLTTSLEYGDFRRQTAVQLHLPIGHFPVVLVVKKHRSILGNLRRWILDMHGQPTGPAGRKIVHDLPLLVIDDEADHSSVNTGDEDTDPSKINEAIRDLLASFHRRAYVGYTATPFANIYIKPDDENDGPDQYGFRPDLFPESFIESLPAPSNYLGPERLFGLRSDDPDEDDIEPLPIFRPVADHTGWIPDGHTKSWQVPAELPASVQAAVESFVLSCAARRARGQVDVHNSMLVHVTRFQLVQNQVTEQIGDFVRLLLDSVRDAYGDVSTATYGRLHDLWQRDFAPTTANFPADHAHAVTWEELRAEIRPALAKIRVYAINGTSTDALEYYENRRTGLSVIAIGGDKLSRGLTLEGLTVSYYLRASRTYDTLLQMGRWFGYRPAHEDLCRLYTTCNLRNRYVEITAANDELRRDFEEMSFRRQTPREFGLRVRASSAGLTVTAPNKMKRGIKIKLSYSGDLSETVTFVLREDVVRDNFNNLTSFVGRIDSITRPSTDPRTGSLVWTGVPAEEISERFLAGYAADSQAHRVRPAFIAEYIRQCMQIGELSNWTVRLVNKSGGSPVKIGAHEVAPIYRANLDGAEPGNDPRARPQRFSIRRILNPRDESTDLDKDQYKQALQATRRESEGKTSSRTGKPLDPQIPTGKPLRRTRRPDQALLLIYPLQQPGDPNGEELTPLVGFAISFPNSANPRATEYVVNDIWRKQQLDMDDEDIDT